MEIFLNQFKKYLQMQSLKMTPQRICIAEVFFRNKGHLSVEEIYEKVKQVDNYIGQSTIYRTLKLLCDADLVKEVQFGDSFARFELFDNENHHDHLICDICGETVEVVDPIIESLQEKLAQRHGYILESHRMYLHGVCFKCLNK